jgi:hypothetical protein
VAPPDLSPTELLHEWQRLMEGVVASAASVAGRSELPSQLVEPMQRQLELVQELVERERRLQREVTGRLLAPFDVAFDLLEESAVTLRRQAEALEAAGRALEDTAALVGRQAELFEHTLGGLRHPLELARSAGAVDSRREP